MNWINGFEILCYGLAVLLLQDILRRKRWQELVLFVSAALAGFVLELLAVRVTGIYHYSRDFYISIGFEPYQFPFFGGLMWGTLTVCSLRTVKRLRCGALETAFLSGWLIVTMDLFLDVAAIRLNGGFWVWDGREITTAVTHRMFMSVIWVNFLGYLFETPAVIWLSLRTERKRERLPAGGQLLAGIGIGAAGVAFVGAASGLSLLLNGVTDEWFACLAFVMLWLAGLIRIGRAVSRSRLRPGHPAEWEGVVMLCWLGLYGFCLVALVHLGLAADRPFYFAAGLALGAGTGMLGAGVRREPKDSAD